MDFLFGPLVQLASSLSPTLFLGMLSVIVGAVLTTVKIMSYLSNRKKKVGILGLLTGQASASLSDEVILADVQKKLDALLHTVDTLSSANDAGRHTDRILETMSEIKLEVTASSKRFDTHFSNVDALRNDINTCFKSILDEFANVKHYMKMHDVTVHQDSEAGKELHQRIHGILVRAISAIEKADEFTRTTVPEFRSYHRELSKDLSDLNRDIALVERSIQNQINTAQAVKLR